MKIKTEIKWRTYPEQQPTKPVYHQVLTKSGAMWRMKPSKHCTRWLGEWLFDPVTHFATPEDITTVEAPYAD